MGSTKTDIWAGRYDVRTPYVATGSGALSETISYNKSMAVEEVRLHVNTAPSASENFTITVDSVDGSAYDTLLKSVPMSGVTDYVWTPEHPSVLQPGDSLVLAWANSNSRTWGLTVFYRRVN